MGNDDDRIVEVDEELLKPADGVEIQMVGRLVQEQDVGVSEKVPLPEGLSPSRCRSDLS